MDQEFSRGGVCGAGIMSPLFSFTLLLSIPSEHGGGGASESRGTHWRATALTAGYSSCCLEGEPGRAYLFLVSVDFAVLMVLPSWAVSLS